MMKRFKLLSMAALVALSVAACDEGQDISTPDVTGTVTGRVVVDGTNRQGVTVTLSNGRTATTDAQGTYRFADVPAGAYTVTISGFPAGSQFPSTTQAAVIATDGQTVTVDFTGSTIRNSTIVATVAGAGGPLGNVTVSLTGAGTGTATTNASGVASFTGMASGNYTVTISGVPAGQNCAVTSQTTTVGAGETRSLAFTCTSATTGRIQGRLFLDENDKNNRDDGPALEPSLNVANVAVTLEGPTIGILTTVQTDANGNFVFANLAQGQYNVTIDSDDPDLPDNVEFGLSSETIGPIVLGAGATATTGSMGGFAFDLIEQQVTVLARLGTEDEPGTGPVEGVEITLYPTAEDAENGTNELGVEETDSTGAVTFTFMREDDTAPGGGTDNIVFARVTDIPAGHTLDPDQQNPMEIEYNPTQENFTAPDAFDFLNRHVVMAVDVRGTGTLTPLPGWRVAIFRGNEDGPVGTALTTETTDANGRVEFDRTDALANIPEDYWFRLSTAQPASGGTGWDEEAVGQEGEAVSDDVDPATPNIDEWLHYVHEGFTPEGDVVDVGDFLITFTEVDVMVRVYHEADDEEGFTDGDNFGNTTRIDVTLTYVDDNGDEVSQTLTPVAGGQGVVTFLDIPTNSGPYTLTAESQIPDELVVLEPDEMTIGVEGRGDLGGGTGATLICPLGENTPADCATFAIKFVNGVIRGAVRDASGTVAAEGVEIRIRGTDNTIQPNPVDTVLTTTETGAFRLEGVTEGEYIVSVEGPVVDDNGDSIWVFEDVMADTVDVEGNADVAIVNFEAIFANTEIVGVVVNDRDNDVNTVDAGEALADVTINLFEDNDGDGVIDASDDQIAETTTDEGGVYRFTGLREGDYIVQAEQPTGAIVLAGFSATGEVDNTQAVTTDASEPASASADEDNARRVGNESPPLPRWDYDNSTAIRTSPSHFTFLYSTGTAQGTVFDDNSTDGVEGMTVTARLCRVTAGSQSPPAAGNCAGSYFPGVAARTTTTDADGEFILTGLREGVWEVTPNPASVSGYTGMTPTSRLFRIEGAADTETGNFRARP